MVISAPSGAGKTTIAKAMLQKFPSLSFSVSATTRGRRDGEVGGKDYLFLSQEEFQKRVLNGDFVELEEIYGNWYGTLKSEIARAAAEGRQLLFDVDVKGGISIQRHYPHALMIFIRPPSVEVLVERLRNRRTEDEATVERRMQRVRMEMELGASFGHSVVNDDLADAIAQVESLIASYLVE